MPVALQLALTFAVAARPAATECAGQAERGQALQKAQQLRAARDAYAQCSQTRCPPVVRTDCERWLVEIGEEVPRLEVDVRPPGEGTQVRANGVLLEGDGPWELDPGTIELTVTRPGFAPASDRVQLSARGRSRLQLTLLPEAPPAAPPVVKVAPPPLAPSRSRVPGFALLGGAAALEIASVLLGVTTLGQRNALASSCAPACSAAQVSDLKMRALVTDALWISAALLAVVGIVMLIWAGS